MAEELTFRAVSSHEWRWVRALRLRALQDAAADIAFLDTYADAVARPDDFWQQRTRDASADGPGLARQFVAIAADGSWLGSVTVLIRPAGTSADGRIMVRDEALVVGVYVVPESRGQRITATLLDVARVWCTERGVVDIYLQVHEDNDPARRVYRRAGFAETGAIHASDLGPQVEMRRRP